MQEADNTTRSLTLFVSSHFMFNVLGKLQSEILGGQKREAISTLTLYSRLLRQACNMANLDRVTLKEEGLFLDNYLKLESERFAESPFKFSISNFDSELIFIPPLLLQPFLEKAFLASIGAKSNHLKINYNSVENSIEIDSILFNKDAISKPSEKYKVAEERLKHFNYHYQKTETEHRFLQVIKFP